MWLEESDTDDVAYNESDKGENDKNDNDKGKSEDDDDVMKQFELEVGELIALFVDEMFIAWNTIPYSARAL